MANIFSKIFGVKKPPSGIDVKQLKSSIEKNPKDFKSIFRLGDYYSSKGRKGKAIEQYKRAAELCIEDGFINKGIAIVKKLINLDDKNPESHVKLANLYMRQNLFGEAILQLQRALELDPNNKEIIETLEKLSKSSEGHKSIIETLQADKSVQIASKFTTSTDILKEAKRQIRTQISSEDIQEHYNLGVAFMEMELYESAIEEFDIALKDAELFEDSIRLIYKCFFTMDRLYDAVSYYESLLERPELSKNQKEIIQFYIGMAYEDSLETEKAVEIYEGLLSRGYPNSDMLVKRIEKLKSHGHLDHLS